MRMTARLTRRCSPSARTTRARVAAPSRARAAYGRRQEGVRYAGRCVEGVPQAAVRVGGGRRRVGPAHSGPVLARATSATGIEGFWSVVCGTWADAVGTVRAGAARAARAGALVIQCNKKRGKGCTVRAQQPAGVGVVGTGERRIREREGASKTSLVVVSLTCCCCLCRC